MKRIILFLAVAALITSSCAKKTIESESDYTAFLSLLLENGFQYIEEAQDSDSFLSVDRKPLIIGDDLISVYEYESNVKMEEDSANIREDGFSISMPGKEVMIDWVSTPYFFKKGTLIINYTGENDKLINLLIDNYGPAFAGYKFIDTLKQFESGMVTVVSSGTEYEPYVHFIAGFDGELFADGAEPDLMSITETMSEIQYTDDFKIVIDGVFAEGSSIFLYNAELELLYESMQADADSLIQDFLAEKGMYILCVRVKWSNGETEMPNMRYSIFDYFFKIVV
jgi:hypothetical protein